MQIEDTLAYLTGTWMISRVIEDHRTSVSGAFAGEAEVHKLARRRGRYEEHGRLRFGSYDGRARRALDLVSTYGGRVAVLFTDGRPFFDLDLLTGFHRAAHQCVRDHYEFEFAVNSPDRLLERWRVRGPQKDYEARTTWQRQ